ncbi:MAG: TetR/AcrR family transcriptional regulator [Leptolyngbya sp. SIO1D8]|nr:TetR/AcrR family transcriptional regulator [Leptolyngbya sp. SIO1D8]
MPKLVDHDRYRKELLMGCFDLFAERGYGSITMRQIAKGLNVSTGTLYHYFPSKESLFIQLVQELFERDISIFLAQASNTHVLEERLRAIMDFVLEHAQYYYQQFLLWVDFVQQTRDTPDKASCFLQEVWEQTHNTLADYLQITNPELVDFIMVFIDGLFVQYIYGRGTQDADWFHRQSELMIQMVIHHE